MGLVVSLFLLGFVAAFVHAATRNPAAPFCIPSAGTLGKRYSPSQRHFGIDIWTGDAATDSDVKPPGNPVYLPYPGKLIAFVKNRKGTTVQGLIFRHNIDAKYRDIVPELQVETIYLHMAIEETGESLVNQDLIVGKEYPRGFLLGHQGNQRWDESKEAGEDVKTHLHFAIRFLKDFPNNDPPHDLLPPYRDPSPYLGYNVNADKGGDDLLPKGFRFSDDEVCQPSQSDILVGKWVRKGFEDRGFLELRKDSSCRVVSFGKWVIQVKRIPTLRLDGTTGEKFQYTLIIMAEPLRAVEDEGDHDRIIMAEPLRKRAGPGKQLISPNILFVGDIRGETIIGTMMGEKDEEKFTRDKGAVLVKSSENNLWSSYFAQKVGISLEFNEDGSALASKIGNWEVKDDVLTVRLVFGEREDILKARIQDNTLMIEGGILVKKEEEKNLQ